MKIIRSDRKGMNIAIEVQTGLSPEIKLPELRHQHGRM